MRAWTIAGRLWVLVILCLIGVLSVAGWSAVILRGELEAERLKGLRNLVEVAASEIAGLDVAPEDEAGVLSRIQAITDRARYDGTNYYFIYNYDGYLIATGGNRDQLGKQVTGTPDSRGKFYRREIVEVARDRGEGHVTFYTPKAGQTEPLLKHAYFKAVPRYRVVVASGMYVDDLEDTFRAAAARLVGLALLVMIGAGVAAVLIGRSLTVPLGRVDRRLRLLAEGELDTPVPDRDRRDEIGAMAQAAEILRLNAQERQRLKDREDALTARLRDTAAQVAEAVDAIRIAVREISEGSRDLAQRTERQAAGLSATLDLVDGVAGIIARNADIAREGHKVTGDTLDHVRQGSDRIGQMVEAVSRIETSSTRIGDIIVVMEEIAFQTKLLALNAAVEAARAGEAGKSFAVVAQEVRALADRSRQASQQIRALIGDGAREVAQGVALAGEVQAALNGIVEAVGHLAGIMPQIAQASSDQSRSVEGIRSAMVDIDRMSQQNAALVEESAAATAALSDQSDHLYDLVAGADAEADPEGDAPARRDRSGLSASRRGRRP